MYGVPRVDVRVKDSGGEASTPTSIITGVAGETIRGPITPRLVADLREFKYYFTTSGEFNKQCSIDYLNIEKILKSSAVVLSRVIEVPTHASILFFYQKTANAGSKIKFRAMSLDLDTDYEFTSDAELFTVTAAHPSSWCENWGVQIGKGTLPSTFKLEVVSNLFETDLSVIKSGGIVRESFDNLNFINFADIINLNSSFIKVNLNELLDANGITEFFSILNDITAYSIVPSTIPATATEIYTKSAYDYAIDPVVNDTMNDTVVLEINGNRYESTGHNLANTIADLNSKINEPFVSTSVVSVAGNPTLKLVEDSVNLTFQKVDNYSSVTTTVIPGLNQVIKVGNAVAGRKYKITFAGIEVVVRYENSSYTDSQAVHNYKLASLIADAVNKAVYPLGAKAEVFDAGLFSYYTGGTKVQMAEASVVITDPKNNLSFTTTPFFGLTVEKTKDNLVVNDTYVLNYKVETVNPDNITFKNIVDFDGGSGHAYSNLVVSVADNFIIPTLELSTDAVAKNYFTANKFINNIDFSIWQPERYNFKNKEAILLTAADPGQWGDSIQVSINRNERKLKYTNTFILEVDVNGITEAFEVSLNKSAKDSSRRSLYIEDVLASSRFIRAYVNPLYEEDLNFLPIETTVIDANDDFNEKYISFNLSGGRDGIASDSAFINAYDKLKDVGNIQINLVNSLGHPSNKVIGKVVNVAKEITARSAVSVPSAITLTKDVNKILEWKKLMSLDSDTICLINDVVEYSSVFDRDVILAPDAYWTSFAGQVFHDYGRVCEPVAGIEKTLLVGISGTIAEFRGEELNLLTEAGINAVAASTSGYEIVSQRSASTVPGFLDRFNVSMLTLFQTYQLKQILKPYLNRLNIPATRNEIDIAIKLYLTTVQTSGCILDGWQVEVSPVLGDIHAVDVKIYETPSASLDLIVATLNLTRSGIKFSF